MGRLIVIRWRVGGSQHTLRSPGTVFVDVAERREDMSGLTRRPGGSTVPKPSKPIVRPGKPPKGK